MEWRQIIMTPIIAMQIMTLIIAPLIITAIRAKRKAHTALKAAYAVHDIFSQKDLPYISVQFSVLLLKQ